MSINASQIGVYVEDSPQNTNHVPVSATIEGNTSITTNTTSGTGVLVSGTDASASITDNNASIDGNLIGIDVVGGGAMISNDHIYNNGTGIQFTGGGHGSLTGNNFAGTTVNGTDLNIDATAGAVTDGGTNAFAGTQFINDLAAGDTLDATLDTFNVGAANAQVGGNSLTVSEGYAIEDRISDYLDDPNYGYVKLNGTNVYVTQLSDTTTPGAIQRGVNKAPSGGTVNVQAGTFVGQVDIPEDLTLTGAGQGTTIIDPSASLASPFSTGSGNKYPIVFANSSDVTIQNLTVDGTSSGNAYGDGFLGVAYYNAGGTLNDVTVKNVENSPFNGVQNGVAVYADDANSASLSLAITNDTINNYQKNGMALFGTGLTLNVADDTVTGAGATPSIAQNGIEVGLGATGTISDNTVSGNEYSGTAPGNSGGPDQFNDVQSTGLLLFSTSGLQVTGNIVDGNDIGIYNEHRRGHDLRQPTGQRHSQPLCGHRRGPGQFDDLGQYDQGRQIWVSTS